jgi:hypothetical protein
VYEVFETKLSEGEEIRNNKIVLRGNMMISKYHRYFYRGIILKCAGTLLSLN